MNKHVAIDLALLLTILGSVALSIALVMQTG